jgi:hypothetical protein
LPASPDLMLRSLYPRLCTAPPPSTPSGAIKVAEKCHKGGLQNTHARSYNFAVHPVRQTRLTPRLFTTVSASPIPTSQRHGSREYSTMTSASSFFELDPPKDSMSMTVRHLYPTSTRLSVDARIHAQIHAQNLPSSGALPPSACYRTFMKCLLI